MYQMLTRLPRKTKLWFNFLVHGYFLSHLLLMVISPSSLLIIFFQREDGPGDDDELDYCGRLINPMLKTNLQLGFNCLELGARKYFQLIFQVLSLLLLAWTSILHPDSPIHQLHFPLSGSS
jgi:hypothetical protein